MNNIFKPIPDIVYLVVPAEWLPTYHRILKGLAQYGLDAIKDCAAACKESSLNIIKYWNIFQSAIAAKHIGDDKGAKLMIDYVNAQLDLLKINTEFKVILGKDNRLYCSNNIENEIKYFVIDPFTGELIEHSSNTKDGYEYYIDDKGNLIEKYKE